jgi:hypothetical protein
LSNCLNTSEHEAIERDRDPLALFFLLQLGPDRTIARITAKSARFVGVNLKQFQTFGQFFYVLKRLYFGVGPVKCES